jgi:hypothetical protein
VVSSAAAFYVSLSFLVFIGITVHDAVELIATLLVFSAENIEYLRTDNNLFY